MAASNEFGLPLNSLSVNMAALSRLDPQERERVIREIVLEEAFRRFQEEKQEKEQRYEAQVSDIADNILADFLAGKAMRLNVLDLKYRLGKMEVYDIWFEMNQMREMQQQGLPVEIRDIEDALSRKNYEQNLLYMDYFFTLATTISDGFAKALAALQASLR